MSFLDWTPVRRIRRNHALEHATIHLLSRQFPGRPMAGRSTPFGFYIYGSVPLEAVVAASQEALERLRRGEHQWAIHPGCGTNYVASGTTAGLAAFVTMGLVPHRRRWDVLPLIILATVLALIAAQPLGPWLQTYFTTRADPGDLEIVGVRSLPGGWVHRYFVETRGG
ncbi:MAG: DUF6391 domain-containing protein [Anaerolineae bacterium]|nr:DUF6391 domain-containing protein [Thermoflexus sp.]MDW8064948.1 DUF6391 domain-containing protein [Anaerolineae bacterium]